MDVTVGIATFGDHAWQELAESRAEPSAHGQAAVVRIHGESLAQARNEVLACVKTPWTVLLDADDELTPGYCATLAAGTADIRVPSVAYIRPDGRAQAPYVPTVPGHRHDCEAACLEAGNYIVIGAMVRTELARQAGFGDEPLYEDWSWFLRMWLAGATVETIPEAVYRAHVSRSSRNRAPSRGEKERAHWAIHQACFPRAAA